MDNEYKNNETPETPEVSDEVSEEIIDETLPPQPIIDLSTTKAKVLQIILGILAGIGIITSMFLPLFLGITDNPLMQFLFVIVFVVVIVIERIIQKKFNVRLVLFTKVWLISLIASIVVFIIIGAATGVMFE